MGDSKRRKTAMGDDYGKPQPRWEVDKLLLQLLEDNHKDILHIAKEGYATYGKGAVTALYPESPTETGVDGQLFYAPQSDFIETLEKSYPVSKYPKLSPGAKMLLGAYNPEKYLVLGLFGGVKPFVLMMAIDQTKEQAIATIKEQVQREISESN